MLFVNYKIHAPCIDVMKSIRDEVSVTEAEKFDTSRGFPKFHIKEKKSNIKISCEFLGRATKDNGFLEGTYFIGKLKEKNGESKLSGIILTAPIYHSIFLMLVLYFIYQCFTLGGISVVPILLIIFNIFMFRDEFRKQGLIKRYIFRSFKITYASVLNKKI